ncbi:hypothetical protein BCR42DRAFT_157410 [Absidia repens]|uniref:FAR-17a/AIG1-like protein-domain-containing protein n=1 Tax=Absidia repens TaxID=90262 RepID=A0A1X2I0J4_9FUNG|nr:hypothetical protein BCR42DRAFT_157410 [Absidia repens]
MRRDYQDQQLNKSNWAWIRWFGFDQFQPERAVTSYWIPTEAFLGIRILTALYSTIIQWTSIAESAIDHTFNIYFGYFTHLTFIGLHAYLVTAVYHHVRYIWSGRKLDSFFKQPTFLNYLYVYLYHTVITFNIVTPIVYWAVLSSSGDQPNAERLWVNVSVHGVSLGMMLLDVIFNRMKVYTNVMLLIIINVVIYMCLTFLVFYCTGIWVYPFLNWDLGLYGAMVYLLAGLVFIVIYFIILGIHDLRDYIAQLLHCAPKEKISPRSTEIWNILPRHSNENGPHNGTNNDNGGELQMASAERSS